MREGVRVGEVECEGGCECGGCECLGSEYIHGT